jgi:hypothetical protein
MPLEQGTHRYMDDAIYIKNADIIRKRWPKLFASLAEQSTNDVSAELSEGLSSTISINGIQLSSRHDRQAEAVTQAAKIKETPTFYLYGLGLGDLPVQLLQRSSLERLEIKIMNAENFSLLIQVQDQSEWLNNPKVCLTLAREDDDIYHPCFALTADLQLCEDNASGIMQRLEMEINDEFVMSRFQGNDPKIQSRIKSNEAVLSSDKDVALLFNTKADSTAFIVGAGPTLQNSLSQLKELRARLKKTIVICVDTAISALQAQSITPDIVVCIDKNIQLEHFSKTMDADIKLVYFPLVQNKVLKAWPGKRYSAYSASPMYVEVAKKIPKAKLYSGGSVIHPAVDLAVKMGSKDIILLGADFAYPLNRTHAGWEDGALGPSINTANSWTLNGFDQRIKTDANFNSYRCELERYIAHHHTINFYNTSLEGAKITGCQYHKEFC